MRTSLKLRKMYFCLSPVLLLALSGTQNIRADEMMKKIAALIPEEQRGYYSDDPAIREAAKGTEIYPWENESEV